MHLKKMALVLSLTTILALVPSFGEEATVELVVDGNHHVMIDAEQGREMKAFIHNSRTMAPLKFVFDLFDLDLNWNGADRSVTTTTGDGKTVVLKIDDPIALVDGVEVTLDAPPMIKDNRTYVPLKYVMDWAGVTYEWDGENRVVSLDRLSKSAMTDAAIEGYTLTFGDPEGNRTYVHGQDDSRQLSRRKEAKTEAQVKLDFLSANNLVEDKLKTQEISGWQVTYFQHNSGLDIGYKNTIGYAVKNSVIYMIELINVEDVKWQQTIADLLK